MRTIEQTGRFKRDYKREAKGPHRQALASDFVAVITALANDQSLTATMHSPATGKITGTAHQARPGTDLPQTK